MSLAPLSTMMAQNNAASQSSLSQAALSNMRDYYSQTVLSKPEKIMQLRQQIQSLNNELERLTLDEPLPSPTQRQLNNNPALQNAWNELNLIWKLAGK